MLHMAKGSFQYRSRVTTSAWLLPLFERERDGTFLAESALSSGFLYVYCSTVDAVSSRYRLVRVGSSSVMEAPKRPGSIIFGCFRTWLRPQVEPPSLERPIVRSGRAIDPPR